MVATALSYHTSRSLSIEPSLISPILPQRVKNVCATVENAPRWRRLLNWSMHNSPIDSRYFRLEGDKAICPRKIGASRIAHASRLESRNARHEYERTSLGPTENSSSTSSSAFSGESIHRRAR